MFPCVFNFSGEVWKVLAQKSSTIFVCLQYSQSRVVICRRDNADRPAADMLKTLETIDLPGAKPVAPTFGARPSEDNISHEKA